ncbi:hypothetical protein LTR62_005532 [Meristemomyces frigidus]|uniref:Glutathione S-transferase kappa n=1 Tax=Meristemomyces frigidus TaxID=1508187 RepID=A0AAN7TKS9_9PEZI|nr:hypothetical protein LTR62_005532 [Meristemomyces frigidus]
MATKRIECYLDCVSPYSYFAFIFLSQNSSLLESHGIDLEFIPVFLGGINVGTGNKPPGSLPAKAAYTHDLKRAKRYFGLSFQTPSFFPILSLRPQRCLIYTKANYPREAYYALWQACFETFWEDHLDLADKAHMRTAVAKAFSKSEDVEAVLASADYVAVKKQLNENTEHAFKDLGAFGAPWHFVFDAEGKGEPFFGSDRYHYIWEYLGLPHCGMELLPPGSVSHERPRL